MTRDEFISLPPRIALGIIYDIARAKLVNVARPDVPRPPLFDAKLSRGDKGFVWMSEMTQSDLEWWAVAKQKTASEGGKWAEQAAKSVVTLCKWIAWRTLYPSDAWSGKRGEDRVTAALPRRDPQVHPWAPRGDTKKPSTAGSKPSAPASDADEGDGYGF